MADDPLLNSLITAVQANPDDVPLRLHVAGVLVQRGRAAEALEHCSAVLRSSPGNAEALTLLANASAMLTSTAHPPAAQPPAVPAPEATAPAPEATAPAPEAPTAPEPEAPGPARQNQGFDWRAAEEEVADVSPPPPFVSDDDDEEPEEEPLEFEQGTVRLADVGGLESVKQRLEAAFLGPMRNPELAKAFGKSLRGGLMLYGPPGCGKTFIARAVAGELGAKFTTVSLADILGSHLGETERNIKQIFTTARRNTPCVLFLDEIDAIGHRRTGIGSGWSGLRAAVNQLLTEMDSVGNDNDGLFVLAATNHPWDVDTALRRPGRLDRTVLVLPPDPPARASILQYHLSKRPLAGVDLKKLVKRTEDFSGADLAHLCETASEYALADSMRTGTVRPIGMPDLEAALRQIKPSTMNWLESARNVAMFGNASGEYDDLVAYLKTKKLV